MSTDLQECPRWYADWRSKLGFDEVEYGGLGVRLFRPDETLGGQVGFAVSTDGEPLTGAGPGDWLTDWLVIGLDTACGDPVFASHGAPHPVFYAMHGQGSWEPKTVAPSLEIFRECLTIWDRFAAARRTPNEVAGNPPTRKEQTAFLNRIRLLIDGSQEALDFWAVQVDIDLDAFDDL